MKVLQQQKYQVFLLYGTTLFGVLLGVVSSIINTRFLPPSDYGDVRYVQNIINFISSLLLFGYFLSGSRLLALSKDEIRSRRIRGLMVVILSIASLLLIIGLCLCYIFHRETKPNVAFLFIVSLPVCVMPLFSNYINTTAQGDNHIGRLAIARVLPALLYIPLAYFIYSKFGATSQRFILLQWGIATFIYIFIIISTSPSFRNLKPIYKELQIENKSYGIQLYIGSLFMVATSYLSGVFLGIFNNDNSEVGFYTLALTVTSPLATLPTIIGTTYFKKFATMDRIPNKVFKYTIGITILSCIVFVLFIKKIVILFYTERYAVVGTYAMWLAIGFCILGIGDMVNRYLGSHGQGRSIRNSSVLNGIVRIFGSIVFVYFWSTKGVILTHIVCDIIYCSILIYYYLKFIKKRNEQV